MNTWINIYIIKGIKFKNINMRKELTNKILINIFENNYYIDKETINFYENKYGKPYLLNYPHLFFNKSYSSNYFVLAISNIEIGIDIEYVTDIEFSKIINKFFLKSENNYIYKDNIKKNQLSRFYELWTKKEAFLKWIGKGIDKSFVFLNLNKSSTINVLKRKNYIISYCYSKIYKNNINIKVIEKDYKENYDESNNII